ncbi:MAG TPA: hypothetical protein VFO07_08555 [Roseiflexaceae bacterium]|nr:hypothetical protein [Roseiflexaceae bacterium]
MEVCDDSYDLFRRAVVERDGEAWASIVVRFRRLMIVWAARSQLSYAVSEHSEDIADQALARAWSALSPERFAAFPNTAALLGYLRACVTATVIDVARSQAVQDRAFRLIERDTIPTPEQATIARLGRDEIWQHINAYITSEAERIVLVERFVFSFPPRIILERHPALFPDVKAVYATIRNLCDRLRRDKVLAQCYTDYLAA